MAVTGALSAGTPRELFQFPNPLSCAPGRCYDVSADGRFLVLGREAKRAPVTRMDLVLNWTATLSKSR